MNIETIEHSAQRYDTVGDYWWGADGTWEFRISKLSNWKFEILVAIHEVTECVLVRYAGISGDVIDEFDKQFEAGRAEGNVDEPGDDPTAPYHVQHCIATGIERIMAGLLGVSWREYDEAINAL